MKTLLVLGHGYTAQRLAKLLAPQGWRIAGTRREAGSPESGVEQIVWPGADMGRHLDGVTHLLMCIAPGPAGDPVLNTLGPQIAKRRNQFDWVGYLSTTGVYGDHQGGWVDEQTPLKPSTKRGQLRVAAEGGWQALGLPLHIFRLAGIYGPGRGPFAKVRDGTARRIIKKNQVFSRIHVDDIAQVLACSFDKPNPGAIYNVCDDEAAPPEDVIEFAADLLGASLPPAEDFETAAMSPMARSFYAESKKVRNNRIKKELGVKLLYPDYRAGLRALLKSEAER